jgi:hypothetical protein
VLILIAHGLIQLLYENQYCETECPCPFCLVPRHVIGTQKTYFVIMALIIYYAALLENIRQPRSVRIDFDKPESNLPRMNAYLFACTLTLTLILSLILAFSWSGKRIACDCPCDDLVEVETPPRSVMALSYIAQALVVTIVGLNMGFRYTRHFMCSEHFILGVY